NNQWMSEVVAAGVRPAALAGMIFALLEATADDAEQRRLVNAADQFLENHGSSYRGDVHWSMLDDGKFGQTIRIVAERGPNAFLPARPFFELRAPAETAELLAIAEARSRDGGQDWTSWEATQWTCLNDEQFLQALAIALRKTPEAFFKARAA